jgi:hypothetical protein
MTAIVISFMDGEVLHAEAPELTFELAILEAELRTVDPNGERALFSVSAIRQVLVGDPRPAPPPGEVERWDRAAFHFSDGEVLRGSIAPQALLGRFGGVWDVVEPDADVVRTIGIPYAALKGVFRIRQWDSRPFGERGDEDHLDQLARVLSERETAGNGAAPHHRALMSRMRRPPDAP